MLIKKSELMRGTRPTRKEKQLLKNAKLNPKDYLRINKAAESIIFKHRITGQTVPLRY